jgi:hypothetical protein
MWKKLHFEAVAAYFVSTSKRKDFLTYSWDKKLVSHFQNDIKTFRIYIFGDINKKVIFPSQS